MRIRPDQGADEPRTRRHDRRRGPAASTNGSGADAASSIGTGAGEVGQARSAEVDRDGRPPADGGRWAGSGSDRGLPAAGGPGGQGSYWHGLPGGGAAGKGPVRGYPPMPGQPPPVYPPGQFSAWNRGQPGGARTAAPGQPAGRQAGLSGPHADWQPQPPGNMPPNAGGRDRAARRYDDEDNGQGSEPSYPMLAVSDPSADVTSTQTWRAVEDGPSTGIWTAPAMPDGGPARAGRHGTGPRAAQDTGTLPGREPRTPDPWSPRRDRATGDLPAVRLTPAAGPAADAPASDRAPGSAPAKQPDAERTDSGSRRVDGGPGTDRGRRALRGQHSGARTGPRPVQPPEPAAPGRAGRAAGATAAAATPTSADRSPAATSPATTRPATTRPAPAKPGTRRSGSKRRAKRPASVKLAYTAALLLVLAAVGTLAYTVLRTVHKSPPAAANKPKVTATTPSPSPSATLGPYGLIASRKTDPLKLSVAQLFPSSFTTGSRTVTLVASRNSGNCSNAVDGSNLQARVSVDGCNQAVRATYVDASAGLMGTIGVLNINTAYGAKKAVKIADSSDFVAQLTTKHGPAHKIGQGTGIEEATAKGHYLILIWAEYTSLKKPKTKAEISQVEAFMTVLLQKTANVSLTNRMLTGRP